MVRRRAEAIGLLFFVALSVSFTFGAVLALRIFDLRYQLNYDVMSLDLVLVSSWADQLVWVGARISLLAASILLVAYSDGAMRRLCVLYSVLGATSLMAFLFGEPMLAIAVSMVLDIAILTVTIRGPITLRLLPTHVALAGFLLPMLAFVLAVELVSSGVWIYNVFDPHPPFDRAWRWSFVLREAKLVGILYAVSPWLLLGALFSWVVSLPALILKPFGPGSGKLLGGRDRSHESRGSGAVLRMIVPWVSLAVSLMASVLIAYYPYVFNPQLRGVDTIWYFTTLWGMRGLGDAWSLLMSEPRAPYLVLLYLLRASTGLSTVQVVRLGPSLPAVFLVLSAFVFLRKLTGRGYVASLGAFLSAASVQTTVGMYAGIYANWLAISAMCLFAYALLRLVREWRVLNLVLTILLGFVILLVHGWTWGIMIATVAAYALVAGLHLAISRGSGEARKELRASSLALLFTAGPVLGVFLGLLSFPITSGAMTAVASGYYEIVASMSTSYLANGWTILVFTLTRYVGGLVNYPLLFALAIVGSSSFLSGSAGREGGRLVLSWLAVASIVSVMVDSWYQWRVFYVVPSQILATLGATLIVDRLGSVFHGSGSGAGPRIGLVIQGAVTLLVCLAFLNYALRGLSFLPRT